MNILLICVSVAITVLWCIAAPVGAQVSHATVYADHYIGKRTASGQVYDPHAKTAAHPSLPFGSKVHVTNKLNGRSVTLSINDRCRCTIDVSRSAARHLGIDGRAPVAIKVLSATDTKKLASR